MEHLVGIVAILSGCIIPVSIFVWLYYQEKDKNRTILVKLRTYLILLYKMYINNSHVY